MTFLLLAAGAVGIAYAQARRVAGLDDEEARRFLVRGVGIWALAAVLLPPLEWQWVAPGGVLDLPALSLLARPAFLVPIRTLLALLMWAAVSPWILFGFRRRDLRLILPFGALSLVAAVAGAPGGVAAFITIPALLRHRWRTVVGRQAQTFLSLAAVLFLASRFVTVGSVHSPAPVPDWANSIDRFADWNIRLTVLYTFFALLRIGPVPYLRFRSVKRRLLVSHVLSGLVPALLLVLFWLLSTYLSVNTERALVAKRELEREGEGLAAVLAAAASGGAGERPLGMLATLESGRYSGFALWSRDASPEDGWTRIVSASKTPEEAPDSSVPAALSAWPASTPDHLVLLLDDRVYLAARAPDARVAALVPLNEWLAEHSQRTAGARFYVDPRFDVNVSGERVSIEEKRDVPDTIASGASAPAVAVRETLPAGKHAPEAQGFHIGATLLSGFEASAGEWQPITLLLRVKVGFREALLGMARHARGNPFNIIYLVFLAIVAALFIIVQVITLITVTDMGRSINRAIAALRRGSEELESGRLEYRIPVEGRDDLWDLAGSFNQMAAGLERGRELENEKQRLESELRLAREIQARLLPAGPPSVAGMDLAGTSMSAREVGGDYYDFIVRDEGIALVIADVSGKGVPAALLMSAFRASLLSQMSGPPDPGAILERVNRFIHQSIETGRFVTAFLAFLQPATGRLLYANAGHNWPLVVGPEGKTRWLEEGGLPVGMFSASEYPTAEETLAPGELILLYTDGVTEAQDEAGEFLGDDRLVAATRDSAGGSCEELVAELIAVVRRFESHGEPSDDVTVLAARRKAAGPEGARGGAPTRNG